MDKMHSLLSVGCAFCGVQFSYPHQLGSNIPILSPGEGWDRNNLRTRFFCIQLLRKKGVF